MISSLLILQLTNTVHAKELDNRFGLGLDNQYLGNAPALSIRYAVPVPKKVMEAQVEAVFGFATHPDQPEDLVVGGRVLYGVIIEDNMNVFTGLGAAYFKRLGAPALRFQPGLEAQFSLMGLDNLTFGAGVGLNLDLGSGTTHTNVNGSVLGNFHYWF